MLNLNCSGGTTMKKGIIRSIVLFLVFFIDFNFVENNLFAKTTIQSIKIEIDYFDENTTEADILNWGSEVGLAAKNSSGTNIKWDITNDGSQDIEVSTKEYFNKEGDSCLTVYAPFGYCDKISVTAINEADDKILDTYSLKIVDGTKWNGSTFFGLDMNIPEGKNVDGAVPQIEEKWDASSQVYSIVLPNVSCSVDGYTFIGWKDKTGRMYQPQETLSVAYTGEVIYYTIYAEWGKNSISLEQTPKSTEKVTSENKETSAFSKVSFLAIAVAIAVIMIKIHQKRK